MTISAVWSGVLSWLKKWRLTRWEFDPRTIEMRAANRNAFCERDNWQRAAAQRSVEIEQLKGTNDLLRSCLDTEREAHANALDAVRQRYNDHPDAVALKKCLDELREKHAAAVALNWSREEEITKLNREYATLRAEHEKARTVRTYQVATMALNKLYRAREENKRLRAKLAAITDRNGAIFDHPEYRKVARRLRAAREKLHVVGRVLRLSLETERTREIGKPFPMKCEFDFSVSATSSPKVAYVQEREYATAPNRSINTDILDTICGVTQVPQSERGPLVNGC